MPNHPAIQMLLVDSLFQSSIYSASGGQYHILRNGNTENSRKANTMFGIRTIYLFQDIQVRLIFELKKNSILGGDLNYSILAKIHLPIKIKSFIFRLIIGRSLHSTLSHIYPTIYNHDD